MSNLNSSPYPSHPMSKGKETATDLAFEPCAATASQFLYAEGSTVVCLRHDTLSIERIFTKHEEDVKLICVDNVSERGAGRLVVTYDAGHKAIVWDLTTGEEVSCFASYEPLTVAAWMRNGNLAFGNEKGEIILFEPATQEHVSARTIFDPITAIAPSADCKTYAIGYRNGSILLAALEPTFTILYTLTTSRAPSPIAALTWHASSSKQKSDMLATYTEDGELRVWSVAKPPINTPPKVIRNLKQPETYLSKRTWISWVRNGRILQHSDGVVWAWDVRTKNITYEVIPTVEYTRGIAAFGPSGTFFTLGPDYTVQQYDVDKAQMVANVRYLPTAVPQTPPQELAQPLFTSESEGEYTAPGSQLRLNAYVAEAAKLDKRRLATPKSDHVRDEYAQASHATSTFSPASKTEKTTTTISVAPQSALPRETFSPVSNKSGRKVSRLRQEVIMSPEERPIPDLFPSTRSRLSDVPYRRPKTADDVDQTPDDLRRQMLSVVFGWDNDVNSLISEELARLPTESAHAVYLTRWLGRDPDQVAAAIATSTSSPTLNWIRLALSSIGDSPASKKIAQVLIEQMLLNGDVHAAVAALIACGDYDDAIEVYVSRNLHMEAVLLTCLLMPNEWQRISFLVRKWGKHVVQDLDEHLAVRCFSCTNVESTEAWVSLDAQLATAVSAQTSSQLQPSAMQKITERRGVSELPGLDSLPASKTAQQPDTPHSGRMTPQTSGLKLITSFGGKDHYKFPGLMSDEGTPINAALITPIAESAAPRSAISPGGYNPHRTNNIRSLNSALASKPSTPGGLHKSRLPSIGETQHDYEVPQIPARLMPLAPPTPADSSSDKEKDRFNQSLIDPVKAREELPVLLTPARYDPSSTRAEQTPQTAITNKQFLIFGEPTMVESSESGVKRNSSRSRKPEGLTVKTFATSDDRREHDRLPETSYDDPIDRPSTTETINSMDNPNFTSPPHTGNSYSSYKSMKSPGIGIRSLDPYISSLEQAQYYRSRPRGSSVNSKQSRDEPIDRKRNKYRDTPREESRSRQEMRASHNQKRSPSSPVPMSPAELGLYTGSIESLESAYMSLSSANPMSATPMSAYPSSATPSQSAYLQTESRASTTTPGDRRKHRSKSRTTGESKVRHSSRAHSRRRSPDGRGHRGRSHSRKEEAIVRVASSPEPLLPSEDDVGSVSSVDPALRIVSRNRQRLHSKSGRNQERSTSRPRQSSPERKSSRMRSQSRQPQEIDTGVRRKNSIGRGEKGARPRAESSVDTQREHRDQIFVERRPESSRPDYERPSQRSQPQIPINRRTKELAQAELEARRLSLQRRPSAPAVPFPGQDALHARANSVDYPPPLQRAQTDTYPVTLATLSAHPTIPEVNPFSKSRPTTPRAMKHPYHTRDNSVPDLPATGELLGNDVYRPSKMTNNITASPIRLQKGDVLENPEIPYDMPKHPAFDSNIGTSRPSSRSVHSNRHASPARAVSRDRNHKQSQSDIQILTIGEEDYIPDMHEDLHPVVPELQHLAMPPPPPPPPAPPMGYQSSGHLRIQTSDFATLPANIPLPASAYPGSAIPASAHPSSAYPNEREQYTTTSPPTNTESRHRRGRSGSEHQIVGKIRTFAGRMRSSSRGRSNSRPRENSTKSPPLGVNGEESYSPYESISATNNYNNHLALRELSTVMEGR